MTEERFVLRYLSEGGLPKEHELFLVEEVDSIYHTIWETKTYPLIRITQRDYLEFVNGKDIEVLSGDLDEMEKELIAHLFNERMDVFMNRRVRVDVVIKREEDDLPFEYATLSITTFYLSESGFVKKSSFTALMNNTNGYCPVEYLIDPEFDDRYVRIDDIEIGYKIPRGTDKEQRYFKGEVFYTGDVNNGVVRAISDEGFTPRVDVRVSFISDLLVSGVEIKDEVFHGTTTMYIS